MYLTEGETVELVPRTNGAISDYRRIAVDHPEVVAEGHALHVTVELGTRVFASLGFAKRRFGSDRDATLLQVAAQKGWEPGGAGRLDDRERSRCTHAAA